MLLKLDLHVHGSRSFDGVMSRAEIRRAAARRGLDAVCICDHGVSAAADDFNDTDDGNVIIVPGIEFRTQYGCLEGLFIEREIEVVTGEDGRSDFFAAAEAIKKAGGVSVIPHPFEHASGRIQARTDELERLLPYVDGIEVYNSRASYKLRQANSLASGLADRNGVSLRTAGSDAHRESEVGGAYVTLKCASRSLSDIKSALLAGKAGISGRPCKKVNIALSQLVKERRTGAPPKRVIKTLCLMCFLAARDAAGLFEKEKKS